MSSTYERSADNLRSGPVLQEHLGAQREEDQPRRNDHEAQKEEQHAGKDQSDPGMVGISGAQHALDHELVHHVVPDAHRQRAEHESQRRAGDMVIRLKNGQPVVVVRARKHGMVLGDCRLPDAFVGRVPIEHDLQAFEYRPRAEGAQAKYDEGDAAERDDGYGERVSPGDRGQAPVDRPDARHETQGHDAKLDVPAEELLEGEAAGIQHCGHETEHVHDNGDRRESQPDAAVKAKFQELGNGDDLRRQQERHPQEHQHRDVDDQRPDPHADADAVNHRPADHSH